MHGRETCHVSFSVALCGGRQLARRTYVCACTNSVWLNGRAQTSMKKTQSSEAQPCTRVVVPKIMNRGGAFSHRDESHVVVGLWHGLMQGAFHGKRLRGSHAGCSMARGATPRASCRVYGTGNDPEGRAPSDSDDRSSQSDQSRSVCCVRRTH